MELNELKELERYWSNVRNKSVELKKNYINKLLFSKYFVIKAVGYLNRSKLECM